VNIFVVFFISDAQQRGSLSCVFSIAHGEKNVRYKKTFGTKIVCRAFFLGARQTFFPTRCYPRSQPLAYALSLSFARTRHTSKTISLFAVRFLMAHDKHICLSCVFLRHTTKYFKKNECCTSFYFSTTKKLFCTLYFNFIHVSINLLFLTIMCRLKNCCRTRQI
jgi:hypothetical protein